MKSGAFFRFVLPGLAWLLAQNAYAGSAVAIGRNNQLVFSAGWSEEEARNRAIDLCRRKTTGDVRLLASTDVAGYGAVAVARRRNGWVIGVSLGRPSALDAEHRAIGHCLKAGGTDPKVKWGFRG